ncbi:MAG: hypothetical protein HOY79_51270 [Streptomyces sp.]|nr:hypothetical protein [Streptomyces sp.]
MPDRAGNHGEQRGTSRPLARPRHRSAAAQRRERLWITSASQAESASSILVTRSTTAPVAILDDLRVRPSTRRYDQWSSLRMLWWQNPVTARLRLGSARMWRHWYETTVR